MQIKKQANATITIAKKVATVQKMKEGARFYPSFVSWLAFGCGLQHMLKHISILELKVIKNNLFVTPYDHILYYNRQSNYLRPPTITVQITAHCQQMHK